MGEKENLEEKRLLSSKSLDELIKIKMEEEMKKEFERAKIIPEKILIKNIKEVPQEKVFSKNAIYKVFNKNTHQETYISGIQAEAMLGIQNSIREKIRCREMDAFSTDYAYVKFEKIEIEKGALK